MTAGSEEFGFGSAERVALCGPARACPLVNGDVGAIRRIP